MRIFLYFISLLGLGWYGINSHASQCIAHRGNSSHFFENSLEALQSAAEIKSHGVEFDLRHTADKKAIVLHDEDLQRVTRHSSLCPRKKKVDTLSFNDLGYCQLLNGEPIPTLETTLKILSRYPIKVFLEFKDPPTNADLLLINDYYKYSAERVYLISFSASYLFWLYLEIKERNILKQATLLHLQKYPSQTTSFHGVNLQYNHTTATNITELKKQNKQVGVWTVDDPLDIKKFISLSVDFITTNYPARCLARL